MAKHQQLERAPRGRPVSCRLCRSRKLRCSRDAPCSECVSRGLRCELEDLARGSPGTPSSSEPELLERIRRLEELLEDRNSHQTRIVKQHPGNPDPPARQADISPLPPQTEHLDGDVAWLESIYNGYDLSVSLNYLGHESRPHD